MPAFTVFQDAPSEEVTLPKVARPRAMTLRSARVNVVEQAASEGSEGAAIINKENMDPLTGDRVGAATNCAKKRKVLATKVVAPAVLKGKKSALEPELKKRKALTATSSKLPPTTTKVVKPKKDTKTSTSKVVKKRTVVKKVATMPPVNEEEEVEKENDRVVQAGIDSRVYDLTVKPLADVSEAYDPLDVFGAFTSNSRPRFNTYKAASVEPEQRDYCFPPKDIVRRPSVARFRAASEGIPDHQPAFSTPERKKIYAAFTFSSPPRQANGDFL